jgi:hypothetical protein
MMSGIALSVCKRCSVCGPGGLWANKDVYDMLLDEYMTEEDAKLVESEAKRRKADTDYK